MGAKPFSLTAFSISTNSVMTVSIIGLFVTLSVNGTQHIGF